jgi:hypothetical protein
MSPQFVDFNHDGTIDIVAGTFDGSPHLARGTANGFGVPEQITDADGARIVLNMFWNFDQKRWDDTKRYDADGAVHGHLTSAVAYDWDRDQDFDLLLGDHATGRVYLRRNEGGPTKAAFGAKNLPVRLASGELLDVPGTVATLRLVDWDRDGRLDLLASGMGKAYEGGGGGGVYLFFDHGSGSEPEFSAPVTLIAPGTHEGLHEAVRPDSGYYADAGDLDGDGDWDLVVGGYSHWQPVAKVLSVEEEQRVSVLRQELAVLDAATAAYSKAASAAIAGLEGDDARKRAREYYEAHKSEMSARAKETATRRNELDRLVPGIQRKPFVWFYENLAVAKVPAAVR